MNQILSNNYLCDLTIDELTNLDGGGPISEFLNEAARDAYHQTKKVVVGTVEFTGGFITVFFKGLFS